MHEQTQATPPPVTLPDADWMFRQLQLLPLFALHVVLLLWAAVVFSVASLYQVTLNSWRDGRKSLPASEDAPVIVTSMPLPPRRGGL